MASNNVTNKGYGSRDSIRGCEDQSDLFYSIRNPYAPPRPARPEIYKSDSIESLQSKLEAKAQSKLEQGESGEASRALLLVVKMGKLIFMGAVFPVYLTLYTLPHLLLTKAIPKILRLLYRPIDKAAKKGAEFAKLAASKIAAFFTKTEKPREKKKSLYDKISDRMISALRQFTHLLLAPFRAAYQRYQNAVQSIKAGIKRTLGRVKKRIADAYSSLKGHIHRQFENLANGIIDYALKPISDRGAAYGLAIKKTFSSLHGKLVRWGEKTRESALYLLKNPTQAMNKIIHAIAERLYWAAAKISGSTVAQTKKYAEEIASILRYFRALGYDLVADRYRLAKDEIKGWGRSIAQGARSIVEAAWNAIKQTPQQIVIAIVEAAKKWRRRGQELRERAFQALKKALVLPLKKTSSFLYDKAKQATRAFASLLRAWIQWVLDYLRRLPDQLRSWIDMLCQLIVYGCRQGVYACRLGIAWATVLCRYGMKLVREAADELLTAFAERFQK